MIQDGVSETVNFLDFEEHGSWMMQENTLSKRPEEMPQLAFLRVMPHLTLRLNQLGICLEVRTTPTLTDDSWRPVLGKSIREMLPAKLVQSILWHLELALDTGQVQCFESWLGLGEIYRHWDVFILACTETEVWLSVRDITDRSHAELNLLQANEALEETLQLKLEELRATQTQLQQKIEREQLLATLAQRMRRSLSLPETLETIVSEVRQFLQTDRVVLYEFQPDWSGRIMVEAVAPEWPSILHEIIEDTCFKSSDSSYLQYYRQGNARYIDDISQARLHPCYVELLSQRQVRANLTVPVFRDEELWGLLIAHHCRAARSWQTWEIDFLERLSIQVGIAIEQASLYSKLAKELNDRQQAQQQLQVALGELEAQKSAMDQAIMMAMLDDRGILTDVNEKFCQVSQCYRHELLGKSHHEFFKYSHPQKLLETLWPTISQGQVWRGEVHNQAKDDDYWVDVTIVPYLGSDGVPVQYLVLCFDVTQRRVAQTQLRAIQKRLQYVLSSSPAILYTCKPHNQRMLTFISSNIHALLGWRAHQFLTSQNLWLDLIHPEDVGDVLEILANLPAQGHLILEYRFRQYDGSYHWLRDEVKAIFNDHGQALEYIGSIIDISDRKQAEAEVLRALAKEKELNEMKSHFVSQTSHEFRTPLATIFAASELLKRFGHKLSDQKKQERLEKIQAEVKHMTRLLEDVLLLGKSEAGYLECHPQPLDLERLCQEVLEEIEMIKSPAHQLVFSSPGQGETIAADEILLRQILVNLLSNAVKYSPKGGTIQLTIVMEEHQTIFQVQDQGIGVAEADQIHLFKDFYRASNVNNLPGTGLGLAIVKRAVDLHGGTITLQSKIGEGSLFTVCLPKKSLDQDSFKEKTMRMTMQP